MESSSGSNSAGRMPASQAGRRGFESRLPLHLFNNLQGIKAPSKPSINPPFAIVSVTSEPAFLCSMDLYAYPPGPCEIPEQGASKAIDSPGCELRRPAWSGGISVLFASNSIRPIPVHSDPRPPRHHFAFGRESRISVHPGIRNSARRTSGHPTNAGECCRTPMSSHSCKPPQVS